MLHIAVIGCGVIGSRHAQALGLLTQACTVYLVDPSPDARQRAADLVAQDRVDPSLVRVETMATPDLLPTSLDVAVVATTSALRRQVVETLLARGHVRYFVLEKFLFQCPDDYRIVGDLLDRSGSKAWVNCPRRMWPGYTPLRAELQGPVSLNVATHGRYGIGTSAIHLFDLLVHLSGESDFTWCRDAIDIRPLPHRSGGIELSGTLFGHGQRGSFFRFTAYAEGTLPPLTVIDAPNLRAIIDEGRQTMRISRAASDWVWQDEAFAALPQSRLTNQVVDALIAGGTCPLPDYAESARLHLSLLTPLLQHYRDHVDQGAQACPIT